ncbi:ABC-2 type transport system permease protein [Streptomyces sp. SAI-144]|jgi:ABC-2 type transport system permease protein|uniref:ABC transporter permease n=1 Tax=unclassified Streptomyces TaxID=2593676 RepID=UPI00247355AD|nr:MULTISPECIES: ABC transporter permease [unclassified Streptomyces]MDH6439248.1 ABC-2 type transport system permease protein [Streptomyces sp. SAI-144]MDH6486630.1 ABC-2 type transport system permease protein [Streptomyces sp. SAI-127]
MSTLSLAWHDSSTMLRRNLRHATRNPSTLLGSVVMPCVLMLLFVFAFGGTMGNGLGGAAQGIDYVDYLAPGIFLLALTVGAMGTSIAVAVDMTKGIINRFRTMAISRASVLTGHVVGSVIQSMVSIIVVIGIAVAVGFRPTAGVLGWLAAFGLMALVSFALTWVAVGFGLLAKTVDSASNMPMILQVLPFLSSTFVPAESMASGLRWFSENEPFTPITDTLRNLLLDRPVGNDWIIGVAWCLGIALVGYLWSKKLYKRDPRHT